ncbi:MAG: type II secretion system F family protein [Planctomycetes bacterium]|nr:type II secretion system F family protein [Planctomycetota bacterium]
MPLQKIQDGIPKKRKALPVEGRASSRRSWLFSKRVSPKALSQFTLQLATLQNAGLPLVRCLKILEGQMRPGLFKEVLLAVTDDVEGGSSLSEAFGKHPGVFDRLYINMVRAGEAGGILDEILTRLAQFSEKTEKIKSKIKEALTYPTLVLLFMVGILTFIMLVVVPRFEEIFENFGKTLPVPTRLLIGVSDSIVHYSYLYLGFPLLAYLIYRWSLRNDAFRFYRDRWLLRIPLLGDTLKKTMIARFARTLGTLLQSGVPILEGLSIVKGAIANTVLERAVRDVHDSIREGERIAVPLGESGLFDDLVVNMIDVGEATGSLDNMLLKVADAYENEVDFKVSTLFKVIEPALIIALAVVVGFIVMALFLPILKIMPNTYGNS